VRLRRYAGRCSLRLWIFATIAICLLYCSQGVPQIFAAPVYRAHCAVIFVTAQLSCLLARRSLTLARHNAVVIVLCVMYCNVCCMCVTAIVVACSLAAAIGIVIAIICLCRYVCIRQCVSLYCCICLYVGCGITHWLSDMPSSRLCGQYDSILGGLNNLTGCFVNVCFKLRYSAHRY